MKSKILVIGLILILLPFVNLNGGYSGIEVNPSEPKLNSMPAAEAGTKLYYNISEFEIGEGLWDLLAFMFEEDPEMPNIGIDLFGNLKGSELIAYITLIEEKMLYKEYEVYNETYDYWEYFYDNATEVELLQPMLMLLLNNDVELYANLTGAAFPDDALHGEDLDYWYHNYPRSYFTLSEDFWIAFNDSFIDGFYWGFGNGYANQWFDWFDEWYHPYKNEDPSSFGEMFGWAAGYNTGGEAGIRAFDTSNLALNDSAAALNGYILGWFEARDDGFNQGKADFISSKVPDRRFAIDMYGTAQEIGQTRGHQRFYDAYYMSGFLYEGEKVLFNKELLERYYSEHNLYPSGWLDGYDYGYWHGFSEGAWHKSESWSYDPIDQPYWAEMSGDGPYPEGYNEGLWTGYFEGYHDGYNELPDKGEYIQGMHNAKWTAFHDGFANGTADHGSGSPYDCSPPEPYPSPTNQYEEGYNNMYHWVYCDVYSNGWKYSMIINNDNPLSWMMHLGPFYNVTLPDLTLGLQAGSLIPFFGPPPTMFTELNFELMEYRFNHDAHGWDYYDPFTRDFSPFGVYVPNTNWTAYDGLEFSEGNMTIKGYYDEPTSNMTVTLFLHDPDMPLNLTLTMSYNSSTGYLFHASVFVDFYEMENVYFFMSLDLLEDKTETFTLTDPDPLTWAYAVDTFTFYYDASPEFDDDFHEGIHEFKMDGLDSVGNTFLDVTFNKSRGLWAYYDLHFHNPANVSDEGFVEHYNYPTLIWGGPQIVPDWNHYSGLIQTGTSILSHVDYIEAGLAHLSDINTTFDLRKLILNPQIGEFHYVAEDIMYYYLSVEAAIDFDQSMINGEGEWEDIVFDGYVNGTAYIAFDYTTGIFLGAGVELSLDFELSVTIESDAPETGYFNAYFETSFSIDGFNLPKIQDVITGVDFPMVSEFNIVSILSIIGLAAISSAVIFLRRR